MFNFTLFSHYFSWNRNRQGKPINRGSMGRLTSPVRMNRQAFVAGHVNGIFSLQASFRLIGRGCFTGLRCYQRSETELPETHSIKSSVLQLFDKPMRDLLKPIGTLRVQTLHILKAGMRPMVWCISDDLTGSGEGGCPAGDYSGPREPHDSATKSPSAGCSGLILLE